MIHKIQFFCPHHAITLFNCLVIQEGVHMLMIRDIIKESRACIVFKECCIICTGNTFVFHPIKEFHISGFIPEGERLWFASDITHAHHIPCTCDDVCDSVCICCCIHIPLVDAVESGEVYVLTINWLNTEHSTCIPINCRHLTFVSIVGHKKWDRCWIYTRFNVSNETSNAVCPIDLALIGTVGNGHTNDVI